MTSCGTAAWAAPEILKNSRYTEKADVYSFGICLWEFWTRKDPYEGMPTFQIIFAVGSEGARPVIPDLCPPDYAQLIRDCNFFLLFCFFFFFQNKNFCGWTHLRTKSFVGWDGDPSKRPSFDVILGRISSLENPDFDLGHNSANSLKSESARSVSRHDFFKNNIN